MYKVLLTCGNGMGSSVLIGIKVNNVFNKLKLPCKIDHSSVGDAKNIISNYDICFCSTAFVNDLESHCSKTKLIGLKNLLSEEEIEKGLRESGLSL